MGKKIGYQDFVLAIGRNENRCSAKVLASPAGEAAVDFELPFSLNELEAFLAQVATPHRTVRQPDSPEMQAAKAFGKRLFEAVFDKEVGVALRRSLDSVGEEGGLRLKLRLAEGQELHDIPWEYLYPPFLHRFLCLSQRTPIVRYLEMPEPVRPLTVKPPLRILAVIAKPQDLPQLDMEKEWEKLNAALAELRNRRLVIVERLDKATMVNLQRRLRKDDYHVLHYIGHGVFDDQAQKGLLLLEDEAGQRYPVDGEHFGTVLSQYPSLRLVILNACEGARTSRVDPFAGLAQSLVQYQIPAVIAMQFAMTDEAAIAFSEDFYRALAAGYLVEAALAEARLAILAKGKNVEWGTPTLYMRSPEGRIFDFTLESGEEPRQSDNPFRRRAVKPEEFLGRGPDLRVLLNRIAGGESIAIVGQPHIGKTSLLNKVIEEKTRQNHRFERDLFCYLQVQTLQSVDTLSAFWERALSPLEECLQAGQPAHLQSVSEAYRRAKASRFSPFQLDQLFAQVGAAGARLVLFLDDFDFLLSPTAHPVLHNADFYGTLRQLAMYSQGLVLVIATRLAIEQMHKRAVEIIGGSPFFNNFVERPLGALLALELSELLDRAGERFDSRDREFIAAVSGGHPYLAQVAAATLWDMYAEGLQGALRYRTTALELYRETERHFADTWRLWSDDFHIVITAVALTQLPRVLAQPELLEIGLLDELTKYAPDLTTLEGIGVVKHESDGWNITQGALLWWLVDELLRARIRAHKIPFEEWLKKPERLEQQTMNSAVKKVLAALPKGAVTLIEAFVKRFGE